MSKIFTRISSGKFKGKCLELPSLSTTRSTKSIVKDSFFNSVRYELAGRIFIEGFGGSGAMAAEAVSNGASKGVAIELDAAAFRLTAKNLADLNDENLRAINGDSFEILPRLIASENLPVLLYLDPPFDVREGFAGIYDRLTNLALNLEKGKIFMIVFEHASSFKFGENLGNFKLIKSKKFGATTLSYFA